MKSQLFGSLSNPTLPIILVVLVVAVGAAAFFVARSASAGLQSETIRSGRFERTYSVYVPPSYIPGRPAPVLLAYHGAGGTGAGMRMGAGLDALGDRYGAIVVYPDALAGGAWALGCANCTPADAMGVDDAQFTLDLLDDLGQRYSIDQSRVYATGHSLGGSFVGILACRHADRIAGVAIVASLLIRQEEDTCKPARPVSYLLMIGANDPNVPWTGGGRYGYVGAEETARLWGQRNGCTAPVRVETLPGQQGDGVGATIWSYESCCADSVMRLYRIENHGHGWPTGPAVSAPEEIGRWLLDGK